MPRAGIMLHPASGGCCSQSSNMNSLLISSTCATWLRALWGLARPMGQRLPSQKSVLALVSTSPVSARLMVGCQSKLSLSVPPSL